MRKAFDFLLSIFKKKIRITFFQDDFQPLFSLRFTLVTFLIWIIGYATIIIMITLFIISKTSLKEYIPGYGGIKEKKQILQLIKKTDSLENVIQIKGQYVQNILR
ncbi:MAG: hypothetical protein N2203_07000, partial [Bacteroidia bacterium]|nr:hypothetical protein [Bacteroidia bacterium]